MLNTAEEAKTNSYRPLRTDLSVLADQQELTYNSSVRTQDVV